MLQNKAMIAKLHMTQWSARRKDNMASEFTVNHFLATKEAGNFNKALVAKKGLQAVREVINAARKYHYENTVPWGDQGERLLPSKNYINYTRGLADFKAKFEFAVNEFVQEYQNLINQAQSDLGNLFDANDYPSQHEIEQKFKFEINIDPVTTEDDFRVQINQEEVEKLAEEKSKRNKENMDNGMQDLWQRLFDAVQRMYDQLSVEKDSYRFKNTLVGNLVTLTELLPNLNVTEDQKLNEMCDEIQTKLCTYDPKTLRKDPKAREEVASDANDVLESMEAYMGNA